MAFSDTFKLMKASWSVVRQDKELMVFPLLSGICSLLVMASFVIPLGSQPIQEFTDTDVGNYLFLFAFYFASYFVITFFNTAVVACAIHRMQGGDPTVAYGLSEAVQRIHLIVGWALLGATIGTLLRIIESRFKKVGELVSSLLGTAWTLATYFVVPVLVMERKGPVDALKSSAGLLGRTWGNQLVSNMSFGLISFLLMLPGIGAGIFGYLRFSAEGATPLVISIWITAALWLVVLVIVMNLLGTIFQAALYLHANGHEVPGFEQRMLAGSFKHKDN